MKTIEQIIMTKYKLLIIVLFSIALSLFWASNVYAVDGCCMNPGRPSGFVCSETPKTQIQCCPTGDSNYDKISNPGGPADQQECIDDFFISPDSCPDYEGDPSDMPDVDYACYTQGCCCKNGDEQQGVVGAESCTGILSYFIDGDTTCTSCQSSNCNDISSNDGDACIDAADPDCLMPPFIESN